MYIEVRGGSKPLWVYEFCCYLPDGEMAFSYHKHPELPRPSWLRVPEGSQLREQATSSKNPERPIFESRSMRGDAESILAFYQDCIDCGGLDRIENPVVDHVLEMTQLSRIEPGFYAENSEFYFSLEIFQHKKTVFWTVEYGQKLPPSFRSKKEPKYLLYGGEQNGRVTLRNPDSGDEYWTPAKAMTDSKPKFILGAKREREREKRLPILWSLLPSWMQFDLTEETMGTATPTPAQNRWAASIYCMKFEGCPHEKLEACLNYLDQQGFDGTGIEQPDRSYFLTCFEGGRHMEVDIKTEIGESGYIIVVSTLDTPSLYLHYFAPGTELPGKNP
ncbi:MAG: hypothetical protein ABSD72_06025 [Terracidiphilus sp.]|jgi:hypothetical protein